MFETLCRLPADPILGLGQAFKLDSNPQKINLSVGVYQDAGGNTPIFSAVKRAEQQLIEQQKTKAYIAQAGDSDFLTGVTNLLLGDDLFSSMADRVAAVMTPGGCGALRMGAELLISANDKATVWVSDPTWANHYPLLQSAGLKLEVYNYFDPLANSINFAAMLDSLENIPNGDTVLLHGCCHNPTGSDLTPAQWDQVIDLLAERQLLPFIDVAYQGFGDGVDADAYGVRKAIEKLPEVLIASSCSKNFGLYRERTGAIIIIGDNALAAQSHVMSAARRSYSMSPYHGGGVVGKILSDQELYKEWLTELNSMRNHMNKLRNQLAQGLNEVQSRINFDFVARSRGMFCFLGIPEEDVLTLREQYAIYFLNNTRINIAGLSENNLPTVIKRVAEVITR